MAHFLRGKQAGVQSDFSGDIAADLFIIDDFRRFGISSRITTLAYDPVQSLLAVGTAPSSFGPGQVYVFGRNRISCVLPLPIPKSSAKEIHFCADKLVCLNSQHDLTIYSLIDKKLVASYSPPGAVTAIACDSTLDYAVLGMATGELLAYDIDRENLAPFKLPCLWAEQNPRARHMPVVSLQFHPRDIGKILIGYLEGAVVYSFKANEPRTFLRYTIPRGAPGGDGNPASIGIDRSPKLTHAVWHPTGTFALTGHEDTSLVIWDVKEGKIMMARTLTDTNVNVPAQGARIHAESGSFAPKMPLVKIAWCGKQDPDDTGILIAGGTSALVPTKGMMFFDLGRTPNYVTSSWQILADHFENPKRQHILPTPPNADVVSFCLIPKSDPWFAGAHDPVAILALLASGEVLTMSFPSGYPISPTNLLHLSMSFVHPFISCIAHSSVERGRWLGMTETRSTGPKLLTGGAEATHPLKRYEDRSIVLTGHADGTIRIWDAGHADEIENELVCQADVCRAVGRLEDVSITKLSLSGPSGELAAGLISGELVIFRWTRNKHPGREPGPPGPNRPRELTDLGDRKDPGLTEGFHPLTLLDHQDGPVTAVRVSDIGFIAAGFQGGSLAVIDLRGPAVIFSDNVNRFATKEKSSAFRRRDNTAKQGWVTCLEFSVMTLENDSYSSILLHAGTNTGGVSTLKILPGQGGRYTVEYAGSTNLDGEIRSICPLSAVSGQPAYATQGVVANLRTGAKFEGVLLVNSKVDAKLFKPSSAKGAHKTWDGGSCEVAAVTRIENKGIALVGLFSDGTVKAFTLPGLREVGSLSVGGVLDRSRFSEAIITPSGDLLGWTGPSELALLNVWGTGENFVQSLDKVFNPAAIIPPRPTISNFQWVSGTQYITPSDMDVLIGGPNRPPSKRMLAQAHADEAARRAGSRAQGSSSARPGDQNQEGYWAYMSRQLNERTEKLGIMGDSMDRLETNSSGWADDVSKFVADQKKNLIMGAVKSKFGL